MSTQFNQWIDQGTVLTAGSGTAEQPTVLYEGNPQIISPNADGNVFKMWFTTGDASTPTGINYAESNNGTTWTQYGSNPVLASMWGGRVFKNSGTYYLYCSAGLFHTIQCFTSSNGLTWIQQNATAVVVSGSGWDSYGVGQLNVCGKIGGTWYGYYWGVALDGGPFLTGQVTSTDLINWVKSAGNPVAAFTSGTLGSGQTWEGECALGFIQLGGNYYAYGQVQPVSYPGATSVAALPSDLMRFSASSPAGPWTALTTAFPFMRTQASEGVNTIDGQVADPCIIQVTLPGGSPAVYLYYSATAEGQSGDNYTVNCAIASVPYSSLAQGYEGVQNFPLSGDPSLNLSVLASDNFQRANANPIGGNWSPLSTTGSWAAAQLLSDLVTGTTLGDGCDSYWNALSWANDQWSMVTVHTNTASYVGCGVRYNTSGTQTGYRLFWNGAALGSSGTLTLQKVISGGFTSIGTLTLTMNVGDTLLLCAIGTQLLAYWNGLLLMAYTDSAIASGAPGFVVVAETAVTNAGISAWSGGTFQNAPNPFTIGGGMSNAGLLKLLGVN
jgi:hypothetical protein